MDSSRILTILNSKFPKRYILAIMGLICLFNARAMRNLVLVITQESAHVGNNSLFFNDSCSRPKEIVSNKEYYYSKEPLLSTLTGGQHELIETSFFWGYILTQIPAAFVSECYGGKHVLSVGMTGISILILTTPTVLKSKNAKYTHLLTLRVFEGCFEGTMYPALNAVLAQWLPRREKSSLGSIVFSGAQLGVAGATYVGMKMVHSLDIFFYVFGGCGLVWVVLWQLLCYSSPQTHPFIHNEEKEYLERDLAGRVVFKKKKIPWNAMMSCSHVWAAIGLEFGHNWAWICIVTQLSRYMTDVLKFTPNEYASIISISILIMCVMSIASGFLCDFLIYKDYMGTGTTRKVFITIGYAGANIFMVSIAYAVCDRIKVAVFLAIALTLMSTYNSNARINPLDLSPNYAGVLMAFVNGLGNTVGLVEPFVKLFTTPHETLWQWKNAFWICFFGSVLINLSFVVFGSGQEQTWNMPKSESE